jgi:hypothetical protein
VKCFHYTLVDPPRFRRQRLPHQLQELELKPKLPLKQEFLYYIGAINDTVDQSNQASGAYIFPPKTSTTANQLPQKIEIEVVKVKYCVC